VEALLSSVHQQVPRQFVLSAGAVIAVRTVEALLPSVHEQVSRQVALASGFVIAVLANVLHHHLERRVCDGNWLDQAITSRQTARVLARRDGTDGADGTDREGSLGTQERVLRIERSLTRAGHAISTCSVAHGRLPTCTTAAAPLWNLAVVAMQLLDAMTCKRCVCCDAAMPCRPLGRPRCVS
jgi:hypothetical protein